ncbi:hypothetical protein QOT17_013015 [Balamuthia mandrillaris]
MFAGGARTADAPVRHARWPPYCEGFPEDYALCSELFPNWCEELQNPKCSLAFLVPRLDVTSGFSLERVAGEEWQLSLWTHKEQAEGARYALELAARASRHCRGELSTCDKDGLEYSLRWRYVPSSLGPRRRWSNYSRTSHCDFVVGKAKTLNHVTLRTRASFGFSFSVPTMGTMDGLNYGVSVLVNAGRWTIGTEVQSRAVSIQMTGGKTFSTQLLKYERPEFAACFNIQDQGQRIISSFVLAPPLLFQKGHTESSFTESAPSSPSSLTSSKWLTGAEAETVHFDWTRIWLKRLSFSSRHHFSSSSSSPFSASFAFGCDVLNKDGICAAPFDFQEVRGRVGFEVEQMLAGRRMQVKANAQVKDLTSAPSFQLHFQV